MNEYLLHVGNNNVVLRMKNIGLIWTKLKILPNKKHINNNYKNFTITLKNCNKHYKKDHSIKETCNKYKISRTSCLRYAAPCKNRKLLKPNDNHLEEDYAFGLHAFDSNYTHGMHVVDYNTLGAHVVDNYKTHDTQVVVLDN